jgi:hypothetical protein
LTVPVQSSFEEHGSPLSSHEPPVHLGELYVSHQPVFPPTAVGIHVSKVGASDGAAEGA